MLINRTESSRIDSELRGWFHAPKQPKTRTPEPVATPAAPSPDANLKHELAKVSCRLNLLVLRQLIQFYLV
jgi:cyclic AMP-dependent transcription factor ATF-6 alpha